MPHKSSTAEHHGHHIVSKGTLYRVFGALVGLTILTVTVVLIDLGPLNVPIALGIAGAKASLVVMIFMGLKYDRPMNALVFTVGVIFVAVFLTFTLFDTLFRGDIGNVAVDTIMDTEQQERILQARQQSLQVAGGTTGTTVPADTSAAAGDTTAVPGDTVSSVVGPDTENASTPSAE